MLMSKFYFPAVALAALVISASLFQSPANTNATSTAPVIYVRADGAIELDGTVCGSLTSLKELNASLRQLFSESKKGATRPSSTVGPDSSCYTTPVVIRADESLNYGSFADLIVKVRAAGADPIKIEASHNKDDAFVTVPQEPCPDQDLSLLKPNPLTLFVRIASDGKLMLNQESIGTTADTSVLLKRLSILFQTRAEQGAFRTGTNDVEKTVFVEAARSLSFGEVMKIVDVVKQAGAEPTGLKVDDLLP